MQAGLLIIISAGLCAVISGLFGMAGGLVFMGIIASLMSVSAAMVVHGIVQSVSNGSRSIILHKHVRWDILAWQLFGALPAVLIMVWLAFTPDKAQLFLVLGVLPLILNRHIRDVRDVRSQHDGQVIESGERSAWGRADPPRHHRPLNPRQSRELRMVSDRTQNRRRNRFFRCADFGLDPCSLGSDDRPVVWPAPPKPPRLTPANKPPTRAKRRTVIDLNHSADGEEPEGEPANREPVGDSEEYAVDGGECLDWVPDRQVQDGSEAD